MNFRNYKLYTVETLESNQANFQDLVLGLQSSWSLTIVERAHAYSKS